jgi:hypothetical protein
MRWVGEPGGAPQNYWPCPMRFIAEKHCANAAAVAVYDRRGVQNSALVECRYRNYSEFSSKLIFTS